MGMVCLDLFFGAKNAKSGLSRPAMLISILGDGLFFTKIQAPSDTLGCPPSQ